MVIAIASAEAVPPRDAPYITAQVAKLKKQVAADVTAGKITEDERTNFTNRMRHVETVVATETHLTGALRQTLRNELAKMAADVAEKEQPATAEPGPETGTAPASASASGTGTAPGTGYFGAPGSPQ